MAKGYNKYQQLALNILGTRPILFNPDLARALGSVTAGLFLCQLLYWWKRGSDPELIYKTVVEFEEETALKKTQQLNAQRICVAKGVLQVSYKGAPPKRHFRIDVDRVLELLLETGSGKKAKRRISEWLKTRQSNVRQGSNHIADLLPHSTESTPETTTETLRTGVKISSSL